MGIIKIRKRIGGARRKDDTMAYQNYGEIRWKICCGDTGSEIRDRALRVLYGTVRQYLPYILTVCRDGAGVSADDHVIYLGTLASNPELKRLAEAGAFVPETRREGYAIRVADSETRPGRTDIIIQGADDAGVLYGVFEFIHAYLDDRLKYAGYHYEKPVKPFTDPCIPFEAHGAPAIVNRGLWTWGHKIYDYRGYFENMARCRMNLVVIWNDSAPLNAREVVAYAHSCGIRVIWGFTCAWGEDVAVDPCNPEEAVKWGKRILSAWENEYAATGADGVYFQAFTERNETEIDGKPIAQLVTDFINRTTEPLRTAHPELTVEFGLHATSIRENYGMLAGLRRDVTPVWEDCGGFPYHYDPRQGSVEEALDYTKKLVQLAGHGGRFGVVLKGFTVLKWKKFEHYKGTILLGETDVQARRRILESRQFYWKFCEPYWLEHAGDLAAWVRAVAAGGLSDSTVTALVEDGAFEEEIPPSVGLFADLMWDPDQKISDVVEKIYHSEHFGH